MRFFKFISFCVFCLQNLAWITRPNFATETSPVTIEIPGATLRLEGDAFLVCRTVVDVAGSYTVPYLQSSPDLTLQAKFHADAAQSVQIKLIDADNRQVADDTLDRKRTSLSIGRLKPEEYRLEATGLDTNGKEISRQRYTRIGVGMVITAIGDSITEGYFGAKFDWTEHADWTTYPKETVSHDGRNFPQFAPTTRGYFGKNYAFQSWLTELNDLLAASLGEPVLIANEGWGGITSAMYLHRVKQDKNWQARMQKLQPTVWLVHLGVNDERGRVPPEQFGRQMTELVDLLVSEHHAIPNRILLAKPAYDYGAVDAALLPAYCEEIDKLIKLRGLSSGPDFFTAFSENKQKWYGDDPVHPNAAGMTHMAELWCESLQTLKRDKQP